jgi:hypothetical protein
VSALLSEIAAAEARMSPAELAERRREQAAWEAPREARMSGCSLDERIADLDREIEEAERQKAEEEGGRVVADGRMHRG